MTIRHRFAGASPLARLGAYGAVLALALGGGAVVGATVGPTSADGDDHAAMDGSEAAGRTADLPDGLAVSRDGYTLDLRTPTVAAEDPAPLVLVIEAPDGEPLTDFDVEHDRELHLVVVSRDLAHYSHVHPTRDAEGVWSVEVPAMPPGSYRVFADFVPAGGNGLTLGADLTVPGETDPVSLPAPTTEAAVDGYDVAFAGDLVAGAEAEVTVTITRDGVPVTDLDPYLGALGHLVAIRDGDLAYLHVHPLDATDGAGGPSVRFAVHVPTAGTYGLFFDFSHQGAVRTAAVIAEAVPDTGANDDHDGEGH